MRKIFCILIFSFLALTTFSQSTFKRGIRVGNDKTGSTIGTIDSVLVDGVELIPFVGSDSGYVRIPVAYRTDFEDALHDQTLEFNVLDYGAVSDDGNEDQTAIQAAIDAANTYGGWGERDGGKVVIPAGKWYITDSLVLKSEIEIDIAANAFFSVPPGYTKSIWYIGPKVENTYVHGGYYGSYTGAKTWKGINIQASNNTTSYSLFNRFSQMIFENAKWAINIETTSTGWANGNTFDNMTLLRPLRGIRTRRGASSEGLDANTFNNIQIQPAADMEIGIDSLAGSSNRLTNIDIWDIDILGGSAKTAYINSNSTFNYITGMNIMGKSYADLGDRNTVFTSGVLFESTNTFGTVSTNIEKAWFARTLYYTGSGNLDITTDPQIADGANGQIMTIAVVTNYTVTLDDGDGLDINGPCVLSRGDAITLQYNSTRDLWVEISRSKNRGGNSVYFIAANDASTTEKLLADAQCDGTADEVQINAALTAGYNVRLSSGTFNIAASITAAVSNVIIEGVGKEKTTIYLTTGTNARVIVIGGDYWTIEKLKIDGNDAGNTGSLFGIYGIARTGINIYNCEITNIEDDGIAIRDGCSTWVIEDCVIHDLGSCIFGWQEDAATAGPSNIRISRCHFYDAMVETQVRLSADTEAYAPENWTIDNCYFTGYTGYKGILFAKAKNCNVINSYFKITDCPGIYNPGGIRYYTGASGIVSNNTLNGNYVEVWGGQDVIIKGNYFTHPGASTEYGPGLMISAYENAYDVSNITVEGNTFYNISVTTASNAMALYAETGRTVQRVNINDNIFMDNRGANAVCSYAIGSSGAGTVKNVNISNNTIEGMLDYGIIMAATANDNFILSNNIIIDVPAGIVADDGDDIQITGNKFVSVTTPIDVNDSDVTRPLITENTMYGCTNSGTYAGATGELFGLNLWHDGTYDNTVPE